MENLDELVEPFTAAVAITLREMAGIEAVRRGTTVTTGASGFGDVSATLPLTAGGESHLVLSFPEPTAVALTRLILSEPTNEMGADMVRDCMGEIANVVAGQAKAMLVGSPRHFTFTTPTVVNGPPAVPDSQRWVAEFVTDAGEFTLHLYLLP